MPGLGGRSHPLTLNRPNGSVRGHPFGQFFAIRRTDVAGLAHGVSMTLTMPRAGHYEVWNDGRLVGRVVGDHVIGFRASLPDGTPLRDEFTDPAQAAEGLLEVVPGSSEATAEG